MREGLLMANYDASIRINTNVNPDEIDSYAVNKESLERLQKNIERMQQIINDSFNPRLTKMSLEILNQEVQESFSKLFSVLEQYNFEEMFKDFRVSVNKMADALDMPQIKTLRNINFNRLFKSSFYRAKYDEAGKMAFEYIEETVDVGEDITQEELLEIFNEQIEDKTGWQEKLYNKSEEFKRKYYVFFSIFIGILFWILGHIGDELWDLGKAYITGEITSEPEQNAPLVYYIDQRTEINIIGEIGNYYFIIYTDDDGDGDIGYCEKKNVEFVPIEGDEITEGEAVRVAE